MPYDESYQNAVVYKRLYRARRQLLILNVRYVNFQALYAGNQAARRAL